MPRLTISKHEATSNDTTKNINSDKAFQFKKIEMIDRKDSLHVLSLIILWKIY